MSGRVEYCYHSPACEVWNSLQATADAVLDFASSLPSRLANWAAENPVEVAATIATVTPAGATVRTGMLIERSFVTAAGKVDFLAEAVVVGDRLILKDVVLYGRSEGALTGLTSDVYRGLNELRTWAASQGFRELQITGTRAANSSSAKPGSVWNRTWDLSKEAGK